MAKPKSSKKKKTAKKESKKDDIPDYLPGIGKLTEEQKEKLKKIKEQLEKIKEEQGDKSVDDVLAKKDAEAVKAYTAAIVEKFGKYIKSVVYFGSGSRKDKKVNDLDVAVIVDDTDVKKLTRSQLKEKLFQRLLEMGFPIDKRLHPQPYLLTEFWQYLRDANPVIYTAIRDGIMIYDTGFYLPIQMLMRKGEIKPSRESVDKHLEVANELLDLAENVMVHKITYDFEQAVVNSAQAVLMELSYGPPAPKQVPEALRKILLEKKGLITEEYVDIATEVIKNYKDIEHKEKKTFAGKEYDELIKKTKKFVDKMKDIIKKIRKDFGEDWDHYYHGKKEGVELKRDGIMAAPEEKEDKHEEIKEKIGQR
ncbi:MAG: hypothetical protein PHW96_04055 [Candidatus Nanoarchaeia archaeon]|nr:hypothetical protein [Candidatus Nanoarchaeia archaeon]